MHERGVLGEAGRGVPRRPAAGVLERLRQVPVVQRQPRLDAVREQLVDQAPVEVQARRVGRAADRRAAPAATRPRTGTRDSPAASSGRRRRGSGGSGRTATSPVSPFSTAPGRLAERVPDGRGAAVLARRALDLVRRGGRTPEEVVRKGECSDVAATSGSRSALICGWVTSSARLPCGSGANDRLGGIVDAQGSAPIAPFCPIHPTHPDFLGHMFNEVVEPLPPGGLLPLPFTPVHISIEEHRTCEIYPCRLTRRLREEADHMARIVRETPRRCRTSPLRSVCRSSSPPAAATTTTTARRRAAAAATPRPSTAPTTRSSAT